MAASARHSVSDSDRESSRGSSSTPSSGYVQVGLSDNTTLAFEKSHSFLNWLLLLVLLGGTSVCASIFYYAVPLRHSLISTVRTHLAHTPFKEGSAAPDWAWTGGWAASSSFSAAIGLPHVDPASYAHQGELDSTIASGAVITWDDVEAWLLKVVAPTLYNGSLGGVILVQFAQLSLTKGSLQSNDDANTRGIAAKKLSFDAAEEKIVDFGAVLGGTYAVDATSTIEALRKEGWWGPLTTKAEMVVRGRDGNVADVVFEQQPSGLVTTSVIVGAVLTSGSAFAFAFALAFFLAAMAYCAVEFSAYKLAKRTRREVDLKAAFILLCCEMQSFDDDRTPLYRYLEDRWPCALVATTSSAQGLLMLACCALSSIITTGEYRQALMTALGGLEGALGVFLMMNGWAFMLRLLHALSGASIFFLVLEKSIAAAVNEFGGIFVVSLLMLFGSAACNYVLLGPHVPQFQSFGSSFFYTVSLGFGAPFIVLMPPVAFIVAAVGLLVLWVVIVPFLVATNIQSLSSVVRKVRADQRENLGYEVIAQTHDWMENNIFFCTPDPKDQDALDEELQARLRERREDNEPANAAKIDGLEEREALVSQAEDSAVSEYRRLVLLFVPFIVFFSMAVCFLCDSPRVHREHEMSMAQIMQPFNTTDPFMTREENLRIPPVWMIPKEGCNSTSSTLPESQPKVGYCRIHLSLLPCGALLNTSQLSAGARISSLVTLIWTCPLNSVSPLKRRKEQLATYHFPRVQSIRRSLQITKVQTIGGVYDWLEQILAGQILNAAYNAPSTTNAIPLTNPGAVLVISRVELECQTFDSLTSVYPVRRKRTTFRNWTTSSYGGGNFRPDAERLYSVPIYFSGMETPKTPMSRETPDAAAQVSDSYWTAADYQAIYVGSSSVRTKITELRSAKFIDWQMYQLDILWMSYNGDSKMFVLNRVRVQLNHGGLETTIRVTVVPSWHVNPLQSGIRPEIVFLPLAVVFLLGFLLLSYRAVQKRRLNSFYLIVVDLPMAIAFACYCFFLLCMYNVAFDAGWSGEVTSLTPGVPTLSTGNIPKIVPGPVQPWEWLPGSSSSPARAQPPPTAESYPRFVRIEEHFEVMANYLLFCKICAGLLFIIAAIRFISMIPAIPERMQGLRKLLSHLNAAKMQTTCTMVSLFTTFLSFCLIGYCILGGSYNGFSSLANSVVSCVMVTQAKWNFNSIITVSQQGQNIDWLFQVFTLMVCACFFGFMNYLVLSIVYVRYESLKTEEATEMQSALEAKYGVVQRKRLPLMVNDTVILYFKAFVKCLSLHTWGVSLDGEQPVNANFANLKDEFFIALKQLPEYISKALLSTQIVRLQQFLTDIEFLRAKHYLILHDLGVIAEQMRTLRQVTRRQGKYVAGIEAAIEHVNKQIEEVQTRKAFVSYYNQQDPMHAKQQLEQQQLLDLGMDAGREYARRAVADPHSYVSPEVLEATQREDTRRKELIEEQRLRQIKDNARPQSRHEARKMRMKEAHARDSPQQQARADITPRVLVAGMQDPSSAVGESHIRRRRGEAPWKAIKPVPGSDPRGHRVGHVESDEEDDWDAVRQRFGGDRQGTLEIRQGDGNVLVVKPFPEPPADALPAAAISPPRRRAADSPLPRSEPEEEEQKDEEAQADPAAAAEAARRVADFFATEEGPRPLTNAPEVAEQRAVDLATLRQRPIQTEPKKQRGRRASVLLPTFEAGGQEYRMLPRERGKRS
ncbi:hypothetical protein Emed_003422 [Eimeria media]